MIIGLIAAISFFVALGLLTLPLRRDVAAVDGATLIQTASVALKPAPIPGDWLIEGRPTTEAAEIACTADRTTSVYIWQTTSATYRWHHASDETVTIVDGEVYLTVLDEHGPGREQRLSVGDASFFPTGTITRWRVPVHLRKISTLTRPAPRPMANALYRLRALKHWTQRRPTSSPVRDAATEIRS